MWVTFNKNNFLWVTLEQLESDFRWVSREQKHPTVGNFKPKQPTVGNLWTLTSVSGRLWPGRVEDWIEPHFSMYGLLLVVTEHATSECECDRRT